MDPKGLLLIIDPQYDFIPPVKLSGEKPTLPVVGALNDMERIVELIESNWFKKNIKHVIITQDWHDEHHIANASIWEYWNGDTVKPYSQIYFVREKGFFLNDDKNSRVMMKSIYSGIEKRMPYYHLYDKEEKNFDVPWSEIYFVRNGYTSKEKTLTLWPNHCIKDTAGAEIYNPIKLAIKELEKAYYHKTIHTIWKKGDLPGTEYFSALLPDDKLQLVENDTLFQETQERFRILNQYDKIYVCGEAKTHCVANTVVDLKKGWSSAKEDEDGRFKDIEFKIKPSIQILLLEDMTSSIPGYDNADNAAYTFLETKVKKFYIDNLRRPNRVAVMGDIEGSFKRIENFVDNCMKQSKSLDCHPLIFWSDEKNKTKLRLAKGCELVILGDLTDIGEDNIKVLDLIHKLKSSKKYGKRVHLILGNRDLNKLRLLYELNNEILIDNYGNEFRFQSWKEKWDEKIKKDPNFYKNTYDMKSKINKMKFIFQETMGAPNLFENIAKELKKKGEAYSDEHVYNYYMNTFLSKLIDLMKKGKLIDVIGDTIFVHGGVTYTLHEWSKKDVYFTQQINQLNNFLYQCLRVNQIKALVPLIRYAEGGGVTVSATDNNLIYNKRTFWEYIDPDKNKKPKQVPYKMVDMPETPSVVQGRWWNENYTMKGIDSLLSQRMMNEGYKRICAGHSPVGQLPFIWCGTFKDNNNMEKDLELVLCDTTKSDGNKLGYVEIQYNYTSTELQWLDAENNIKTWYTRFILRTFESSCFVCGDYTNENQTQTIYNSSGATRNRNDSKNQKDTYFAGFNDNYNELNVYFKPIDRNHPKDKDRVYFDTTYNGKFF